MSSILIESRPEYSHKDMASKSVFPTYLELHETAIPRPEPLRIVKRAKTIASYTSSRKESVSRRESLRSTDSSSPPADRSDVPLTIHKTRRRERGSVLGGNFDQHPLSNANHKAVTPGDLTVEQSDDSVIGLDYQRTISVGAFIKSELFDAQSEVNQSIPFAVAAKLKKGYPKKSSNPLHTGDDSLSEVYVNTAQVSQRPSRRLSKSKKLMLKAAGTFNTVRSKSMNLLLQNTPDHTGGEGPSNSRHSLGSVTQSSSSRSSSRCIDVDIGFQGSCAIDGKIVGGEPQFVLYPQISITPEVVSIDATQDKSIWAAIKVKAVLANASVDYDETNLATVPVAHEGQPSNLNCHGYLYGLKIKVSVGSDCVLEDLINESSISRTLLLGESKLILAQIKLPACGRLRGHSRELSEHLFEELEQQLGNKKTKYLSVAVSYRNSLYPTHPGMTVPDGMSYYATTLCTEAEAVIVRHTRNSAWMGTESYKSSIKGQKAVLTGMIKELYSVDKAVEAISRLDHGEELEPRRAPIRSRGVDFDRTWNNSSDTIVPLKGAQTKTEAITSAVGSRAEAASEVSASTDVTTQASHGLLTESTQKNSRLSSELEVDPARKIWIEIRRSSRGPYQRSSILPSRENSRDSSNSANATTYSELSSQDSAIGMNMNGEDDEDNANRKMKEIKDMALSNKRSIGADTLRSLAAPSTAKHLAIGTARGVWPFGWFTGT